MKLLMRATSIAQALFILVLLFPVHGNALQTQGEMNNEACTEQDKAEEKLKRIYAEILVKYRTDKTFINNMTRAQRAWLSYRKAQIRALYPHRNSAEYGTAYPMCHCISVTEMTMARIKELEQWTNGIEIGDVCTGSRSTKQ